MRPDVKGKTVLDIGCNLGWFVRKSLEEGAQAAIGLDFDAAVLESARKLGMGAFTHWDLEKDALTNVPHYNVGFALSVLQHIPNGDQVLEQLLAICDEVYIEQPTRFISARMGEVLKDAEFCGESERGRGIWRVRVREAVPA